jgi:ATP-binding cassette subfamily B protein IrtB
MLKIFGKFFDFCGKINKGKFYKSLALGVLFALMEAMKIPAIMLLIDGAIRQRVTSVLLFECFSIILVSVVIGSVIKYRITMLQCEAGYYTAAGKRIEIAEHMRYLPMGYFNQNSLGQITSVTTNTMEQLADVATRVVMMTTQGMLTTLVITAMVLCFDWRIGLVAVAGIVLFFVVNSILQKKNQALAPVKSASDTDVVEKVLEYVQGISEVRGYNLTGRTSQKLNHAIEENRRINTEMELKFVPLMQIQSGIIKLTGVVMTLLSIYLYLQGSMVLLNCIGMVICSFLVLDSLGTAGNYSSLLRVVDIGVDKAQTILDLPEMDIEGKEIAPKNYDVDINHVDFYYDKDSVGKNSKIIDDVSIHIPEKTTTAIVGPSGGGKTTLCHLIARFWDVDKGSITLGGEDVRSYSMDSLMKNFSFVFQNVYLFQDTIANNIRFGQEDAPMEKVMEAAKKACCHDFIMALPDGYETIIGEGGASLSGGEKQRISIARAIMKDSPVIILDEATANVDPENEKELMEAIEALTKEKTIFMIAHRLKTVRNADRILVLNHGKIVQQGKHEELMKEEGIYKRFVESRELAASWKL